MLKRIITRNEKSIENEGKKLIEEFLIPEFDAIKSKNPDLDFLVIDFILSGEDKYVYDSIKGSTKESTEEILELVEDIALKYGIQAYKKPEKVQKYTFIKELKRRWFFLNVLRGNNYMSLWSEKIKRIENLVKKKEIKMIGPSEDNVITIRILTNEEKAKKYKQQIVSLCESLDVAVKVSKSGKLITIKCENYTITEIIKEIFDPNC